jgi:hypothetical protein
MELNKNKILINLMPFIGLIIFVVILSCYAIFLNHVYYKNSGPFYDSLSYMNTLARVMYNSHLNGIFDSLKIAVIDTTVFFPWLVASFLGYFFAPSRDLGPLIHLPLLLLQAFSAYLFFIYLPKYSKQLSFFLALLLITYSAIFFFNGGISDLRMDLLQALGFGSALAFFAIAQLKQEVKFWVYFAIALGVTFLTRATTPVYAIIVFGCCLVLDLINQKADLKLILRNYLIAVVVTLGISIWFYVLNFDYLKYYYFVWNYDANASLPFEESVKHIGFLFLDDIGLPLLFFSLSVFTVNLIINIKNRSLISNLNLTPLIGGVLPITFLVFFGAALNPFVSMVSTPGILLFLLAPFKNHGNFKLRKPIELLIIFFIGIVISINFINGFKSHSQATKSWWLRSEGLKELSSIIANDMKQNSISSAVFAVSYAGSIDSLCLMNSLVFDQKFNWVRDNYVSKNGDKLSMFDLGLPSPFSNPIDWSNIPGKSNTEKLDYLSNKTLQEATYLILPMNGSKFFESYPMSKYAFRYRDILLNRGKFVKISETISISEREMVSIYRNVSNQK